MRILFDAYWWMRGPISNRTVLRELITTWRALFPQDRLTLAVRASDRKAVADELGPGVQLETLRVWPHGVSILLEMPLVIARVRPDHTVTQNFVPLLGRATVFIQDVLFRTNPEWFTRMERLYFTLMTISAPRARIVFTSSESERQRIRSVVPRARRILAVGIAVEDGLINSVRTRPEIDLKPKGFFLTVGRLNIRKNFELAAESSLASGRISREFPLVIAGTIQGKPTGLSRAVTDAIDDGRIILLGHASTEELAWLYENADTFIFMTRGEGFGLPPLEAVAFGCRAVVSDIPVMHEVLGSHALYATPEQLTEVLRQMQPETDDELRTLRRNYGRSHYTYAKTATSMRAALNV